MNYENNEMVKVIKINDTKKPFEVTEDGDCTKNVKEYFIKEDSLTVATVGYIFDVSFNVVRHFPDPKMKNKNDILKTNFILIGKVQSGKTSTFIALIAAAFDNGYKIALVFAGLTNELLLQTVERITNTFKSLKNEVLIFNTSQNENVFDASILSERIRTGKRIIIISLKMPNFDYKKHLSHLQVLFENEIISDYPVLIIDDEGDQASLNSNQNTKKFEKTATNVAISKIKNSINFHAFVSITATPQANILAEKLKISDDHSEIFLIEPGDGYCGLEVFHGEQENKYVNVIEGNFSSLDSKDDSNKIPKSLRRAIASFLVSASINETVNGIEKNAMLIHTSHMIENHGKIEKKVTNLISDWYKIRKNKEDSSYDYLRKILKKEYDSFDEFDKNYLSFDELEDSIMNNIERCKISVINSKNKVSLSDLGYHPTVIYIGGNTLGRGLTIKGLISTYIVRFSKGLNNLDTVEQRARWFGYRKEYLNLCRIWTTEEIKNHYHEIYKSDDKMWQDIKKLAGTDEKYYEKALVFHVGPNMRLTRIGIADTKRKGVHGWNKQKKYISELEQAEKNRNTIDVFLKDKKFETVSHTDRNIHNFYYNLKTNDFLENCLKKMHFHDNDDIVKNLSTVFENASKNGSESFDLAVMRIKTNERRTIKNGTVLIIQSGRSNEGELKQYKGDDHIFDDYEKINIRIHNVIDISKFKNIPNDKAMSSPFLAYFVPEKFSFYTEEVNNEFKNNKE